MFRKLKSRLFNSPMASRPRARRVSRLLIETLEDRTVPTVVYVTNTNDSGPGSFRQAIIDNNNYNDPYGYQIDFNIPAGYYGQQQTIHLQSALPVLTQHSIIDARGEILLEPDTNPPPIIIDGSAVHDNPVGLDIKADGTSVVGLVFQNFHGTYGSPGSGIRIEASNCYIGGCYFGTDATGTVAAPNDIGIDIVGTVKGNRIGATSAFNDTYFPAGPIQSRNIISGNLYEGIRISQASGTVVTNDYIGTDKTGTQALANGNYGVQILNGANHNTIGYVAGLSSSKYPNVISGNTWEGVLITGTGSEHNSIVGNYIGTDNSGGRSIANGIGVGIETGASYNTVGNTGAHDRNIISGNNSGGVRFYGTGTEHNHIVGNYIGLDQTGTSTLFNEDDGVLIAHGASLNTIGGLTAAERNVISGNKQSGIRLDGQGTEQNRVLGNYIGTDASGVIWIGNDIGVLLAFGASHNSIGGDVSGSRNIISGNFHDGVEIDGGHSTDPEKGEKPASYNVVAGNYIGLDKTGTKHVNNDGNGVEIRNGATNNTIGGSTAYGRNIIAGNQGYQVSLSTVGTSSNVVQNNYLGLDAMGKKSVFPFPFEHFSQGGVEIAQGATNNTIGGAPGHGNVIANSYSAGIDIHGEGTSNNSVNGNYIGLNASGTLGQPNGMGVFIHAGATNNLVGNTRRNVISGNTTWGVQIDGAGTSENVIANNYIGLNAAGTSAVPNSTGVAITGGATNNQVTGTSLGQGTQGYNYISGNFSNGVMISGAGTSGNSIRQNYIGFDATLSHKAVGNYRHGVFITDQAFDNYVGGPSSDTANFIANNAYDGVLIGSDPLQGYTSAAGVGNTIARNSIYKNGKIGIDLGPNNGSTGNTLNPPSGPNEMLNHPELTGVYLNSAGVLSLGGTFYTQVTQTITVEMYANPAGSSAQGRIYLGSFTFQAVGNSLTSFTHNLPGYAALVPVGTKITLTATDELGSTSEFSLPMTVQKVHVRP